MTLKDVPVKAAQNVKVNKFALLFLAVVAFIIGILPATAIISRFDAIPIFTISSLVVAALALYYFKSAATEKPSPPEYLIGWIGAIIWGVFTGFLLLLIYGIIVGGAALYVLIANWLGSAPQIDAAPIASWISIMIAFIPSLFFVGFGTEIFSTQLYPNRAHTKSEFYELVTIGKRRLGGYIGFAALVYSGLFLLVFWTTGSFTSWWFNLLLLICLFIESVFPFSMKEAVDPIFPKAIKAVRRLFEILGYQVITYPITGKPEYDPLLVGLDFFVQNEERSLAVVVRTEKPQSEDQWTGGSLLRSTRVLEQFLQRETGVSHTTVSPVIIVIGKKEKEWVKKGIKVIEISDLEFADGLTFQTEEERKQTAVRILQFSNGGEDLNRMEEKLNISGGEA